MNFATSHLSRQGGRSHNQDSASWVSSGAASCWVVADGLGGHFGGAEASRIACESVLESFARDPTVAPESVRWHMAVAQQAVLRRQLDELPLRRMRTTIVVLVAEATEAVWGHLGDSRLYHLRDSAIAGQTKDHSVSQSLADAGMIRATDVRHHVDRGRLLRAIGEEGKLDPEVLMEPQFLRHGDAFLLCTDGFWENVDEAEMEADFARSDRPEEWLRFMEARLLKRVNETHDNYTAVAIMGD